MATIYQKKFELIRERLIQFVRYHRQEFEISVEFPISYKEGVPRHNLRMLGGANNKVYLSDVLTISGDGLLNEYEIKKSFSDFKNDFKNKAFKHEQILNGHGPSRFYFVVPDYTELAEKIRDYLKENKIKFYGIISVGDNSSYVYKNGSLIHNKKTCIDLSKGPGIASIAKTAIDLERKFQDFIEENDRLKNLEFNDFGL